MKLIICHTDPDGWVSAHLILRHLGFPSHIKILQWSYHLPLNEIEKEAEEADEIFMVDLTLPNDFMFKYASKITRIDHHKSALEGNFPWIGKLKADYSAITVSGYLGSNGKQAEQISACELVWKTFYPDSRMPAYVRLIGRYDVWDHDSANNTKAMFSTFVNLQQKVGFPNIVLMNLEKEFSDISRILEEGKQFLKAKELIRLEDCATSVAIQEAFGHIIAVANHATAEGSAWFANIKEKHPDVEGLLKIGYKFHSKCWKGSCYSVDPNFSALEFIQNFRSVIPSENITAMGGHDKACGFSFVGNPEPFLNCFKEYSSDSN